MSLAGTLSAEQADPCVVMALQELGDDLDARVRELLAALED